MKDARDKMWWNGTGDGCNGSIQKNSCGNHPFSVTASILRFFVDSTFQVSSSKILFNPFFLFETSCTKKQKMDEKLNLEPMYGNQK